MLVLLFIGATFEGPVYSHEKAHLDADSTWVIVLGWSLWLFSMVVRWKVQSVQAALTPKHAGLDESTWTGDEEKGTVKLLGHPPEAPPYERESQASKHGSKHANLFWKGSHGPHHLTFLMQILMLFSAITLAVAYSWLNAHPGETLALLAAFLPILDVLLNHSKYLLPLIVMTTNVEQLKKGHALAETLSEMSAEKTLRMLKLLNTMATQAKRANKSAPTPPKKGAKPQKVDPEQEAALIQAFKFFDSSGDGTIDSTELGGVMASFGVTLPPDQLQSLSTAMDSDGSGKIEINEFLTYMADPPGNQSVEEIASGIFTLLDANGDGNLGRGELKSRLESLNAGLSEADIEAAMALFDKDKSGSITKKEFLYAIKEMKTFDK